jgi:hypothetical protein
MLKRSKILIFIGLLLQANIAFSQSKPRVFAQLPDKIYCSAEKFDAMFQSLAGQNITFSPGGKLTVYGNVMSNVQKGKNLQSVIVRAANFEGAVMQISRQIHPDGSVQFVGRIVHDKKSDGYRLMRDSDGLYYFSKFEVGDLVQECAPKNR